MNEDTAFQELLKAFDLLDNPNPIEYEYRLYYNMQGNITHTTNLKTDKILNKSFVVVDEKIYKNFLKYKIVNGLPELIPKNIGHVTTGIIRSENGIKVVKNHVNLPLMQDESYLEIEYYDYRNNRHS